MMSANRVFPKATLPSFMALRLRAGLLRVGFPQNRQTGLRSWVPRRPRRHPAHFCLVGDPLADVAPASTSTSLNLSNGDFRMLESIPAASVPESKLSADRIGRSSSPGEHDRDRRITTNNLNDAQASCVCFPQNRQLAPFALDHRGRTDNRAPGTGAVVDAVLWASLAEVEGAVRAAAPLFVR